MVARDPVAPQPALASPVPLDDLGRRAARGVRVDDGRGEPGKDLGVRLGRVELTEHHLGVRPGQLGHAVAHVPVLVLLDQPEGAVAFLGDAEVEVHGHGLLRPDHDRAPHGHDRVEDRAGRVRERRRADHGLRAGKGAAPADEPRPVRLVGGLAHRRPVDDHGVDEEGGSLARGARAASREDRVPVGDELGGHEEVREGRVGHVVPGRGDHDLGVAGELDRPRSPRPVGNPHPAELDVVLG